jgi:hypothetical protein
MTSMTQAGNDPRSYTNDAGHGKAGEHARTVEHRKQLSARAIPPARSQPLQPIITR